MSSQPEPIAELSPIEFIGMVENKLVGRGLGQSKLDEVCDAAEVAPVVFYERLEKVFNTLAEAGMEPETIREYLTSRFVPDGPTTLEFAGQYDADRILDYAVDCWVRGEAPWLADHPTLAN